jgi:hypothetical protein
MDANKRVENLVPGDVFARSGTSVLVLEKPVASVETVAPLAGQPCIRVRGRRLDTLKEGDMNFGVNAEVPMVMTSADNTIPASGDGRRPQMPEQHGGSRSRSGDWPAR